jgi:hypothetical protein
MIAVFSGNSNTQRLISDGSGVQLFTFCSKRDSHFASLKNGTRVRDECGA